MDILKNIEKLIKSSDSQNVELARNLIITNTNKNNIIAIIVILKRNDSEVMTYSDVEDTLEGVLKSGSRFKTQKAPPEMDYKELLSSAISDFDSLSNLEYARESYINFINLVVDNAIKLSKTFTDDKSSTQSK